MKAMKAMRTIIGLLMVLLIGFSCKKSETKKPPKNVLLICIDDLRPELKSFGASYIHSPNIDSLAAKGRPFHRHYVNSPSCGPSRYTMLTGRYGMAYRRKHNQQLFVRSQEISKGDSVPPSMPEWFRQQGYTTVSVGKVSHHPGGRGGEYWDNDSIPEMPGAWDAHLMPSGAWENPRGAMHGLAYGKVRTSTERDPIEGAEGGDEIYPDGLIAKEGLKQLEELAASDEPFFLAIGLIKPHLPFGAPKKYLDLYEGVEIPPVENPERPAEDAAWSGSNEFMSYDRKGRDPRVDQEFAQELKRHYAACVTYADKHVGDILAKLKETGADKNTIVVLWGDHGWHLGEHAIWGKHTLYEKSLHSPLIIYDPEMPEKGAKTNAIVETVDLFPTLCDLTTLPKPDFVDGTSLMPIINDPKATGHPAVGYYAVSSTIRTNDFRLTQHKSGLTELYDHRSSEKETKNVASDHPELVANLEALLKKRLGPQAFEWNP